MKARKSTAADANHEWVSQGWASSATHRELPTIETLEFSKIAYEPRYRWARDYVLWWIRNPDKGSRFEDVSKLLKPLDDNAVTRVVIDQAYDGLLFVEDGKVIGHSFFQKHGDALCIFSYWMQKGPRAQLSAASYMTFFRWAKARGDAVWVRLGESYADGAWRILSFLQKKYGDLGLEYTGDGWVCLHPEKAHLPKPEARPGIRIPS